MNEKGSAFEAIIDIYNNAPCGFDSVDADGKFLYINDTELKWFGYQREEVVGKKHVFDFFTPESLLVFQAIFPKLVQNGEINNVEVTMVRKDKTTFPALVSATAVYDPTGKFMFTRAATIDITELKKAETEARKKEFEYRSLFKNMLEGLAYCEMEFDAKNQPVNFTYLEVNQKFEELTGLKNVVGKKVTEVIPGVRESNPELFEIYGRVTLTGKSEKFETYLKQLDVWFSISAYSAESGRFTAVFDVINKQKELEAELQKLKNQAPGKN